MNKALWSVLRLTDAEALLEAPDGREEGCALAALPTGTVEGSLLEQQPDGSFLLRREETTIRRKALQERMTRLSAPKRRERLAKRLTGAASPISATCLAEELGVTRQVIVGDIALLRAGGADIIATPRGYCLAGGSPHHYVGTIASCHRTPEGLLEELYLAVDQGGEVLDVTVEHPLYGELTGQLQISSRYDADRFMQALAASKASPLSHLTAGIHLHRIRCPDQQTFDRIVTALDAAGFLVRA